MNKLLLLGGDNNVEVSLISSIESISIKEGAMLSGWPLPSEKTIIKFILCDLSTDPGGGGGHCRNFWVGMCRWEPGTLNLYQS